ncbi:MAG: copper resistance protein CopC, partial [Actinomycetota bacterium]
MHPLSPSPLTSRAHGLAALVRLAGAGVLACLVMVVLATPASAHAVLEGGSVFDGQVLDTPPEELFLDFNEAVVSPRGGLRIFGSDGERVDEGGTFQTDDAPDIVRVALQPDLADGTYAVTYRVTSADGHPVNGAFVFSVGAESGSGDQLLGQVFSSGADRPWAVLAAIVRWVTYAGVLLAAGAVATVA